jgi:hypothetical protein
MPRMALHYLDFDYSEDDDGNGTWDAMASVTPTHLSALLAEVAEVLRWAHRDFGGRPAPLDEGGDWDWALHSLHEKGAAPCALHYDAASASVVLTPASPLPARLTLTLTLCGTAAFGQALRARFAV